jgi:hypothetical protein
MFIEVFSLFRVGFRVAIKKSPQDRSKLADFGFSSGSQANADQSRIYKSRNFASVHRKATFVARRRF